MSSISQNYAYALEKIYKNVVMNSFSLSSFDNYIGMMESLQSGVALSVRTAITKYFEKLDNDYCESKNRKSKYYYSGIYTRTLVTVFGEIQFNRRYYYPKDKSSEGFYYVDDLLDLPKYDCYDQIIKAMLMEEKSHHNFAEAGEIVSKKISEYSGQNIIISRQLVYNVFHNFDIDDEISDDDIIDAENLYIMVDEKYVHTQDYFIDDNPKPSDKMVKHAVIYTGKEKVGKNRYKLLNKHSFSSIDESLDLVKSVEEYVDKHFIIDSIKNIVISGDGASWIMSFNKDFNLVKNVNKFFALDVFHLGQAVCRITTNNDSRKKLRELIDNNHKKEFINQCDELINLLPDRKDKIESNKDYIISRWTYIKNTKNALFIGCPMESHISHDLAKVLSRDPKGYSINNLAKHIKLRDLYLNKQNIKQIYLYSNNYIRIDKTPVVQERLITSNFNLIEAPNNMASWEIVNGQDILKI